MNNRYSIRRATWHDAAGILLCMRLAFESFRQHYTEAAYEDTVLSHETIAHRFASMQIYVAVTGTNGVIGTIACNITDENKGHLRGMAVHPEWQGRGVALELLKTVEVALSRCGCSVICLDTTAPLEQAIRFYQKNGFQPTGKVTNFFGMPLYEYAKTIASLSRFLVELPESG